MGNYKFNQNKDCEFFPCHKGIPEEKFNCLFCYCPLYTLGKDCGGNPKITNGLKDCSQCLSPHNGEKAHDFVISKWEKIDELTKKNL